MQGIERIETALQHSTGSHIFLLFGEGLEDTYISFDLIEIGLEEALLQVLKNSGFKRIAFHAPHKPVYFLDSFSRDSARPRTPTTPTEEKGGSSRRMYFLAEGPLYDKNLFSSAHAASPSLDGKQGMGDVHAIRLLDAIMQDQNMRSAVVLLQAETTLRFFEDQRTLAGLLGNWQRLPGENRNLCVMLFSSTQYQDLKQSIERLPVPELRNLIQPQVLSQSQAVDRVGGPQEKEIIRLFRMRLKQNQLNLDEFDLARLARWMEAEQRPLRFWMDRLEQIPAGQKLDIDWAVAAGWFSATRDTRQTLDERLSRFIGLQEVKIRFREMAAWHQVRRMRGEKKQAESPLLHMIFSGNPGTGKTSMARLVGEVYHHMGLLKRGHLVEVKASDLVADHVGGTALKTERVIEQALDGVLFVDEAYMLAESERGGFGAEAIETLLPHLENNRNRLVVILAGYPEQMTSLLKSNPGLMRRFPRENHFNFADFSADELQQILMQMLIDRGFTVEEEMVFLLKQVIHTLQQGRDAHFGNAGEMRNIADALERKWSVRVFENGLTPDETLKKEDLPEEYSAYLKENRFSLEQLWQEMDHLTGLEPVREYLRTTLQRQQFELLRSRSKKSPSKNQGHLHLLFIGNPGTGKTTVARLLGKMYRSMGLLTRGHLVEVTRNDLVAGFVGQTAQKTLQKVNEAMDGILFIDEAYTLARGGDRDFGQEAIDTLVKAMEEYSDRLVVVAAGYPQEMDYFLNRNAGLQSRFLPAIHFPDLSNDDLIVVLRRFAEEEGYHLPEETEPTLDEVINCVRAQEGNHFGNARLMRVLFEHMKGRLADRVLSEGADDLDLGDQMLTFQPSDMDGFSSPSLLHPANDLSSLLFHATPKQPDSQPTGMFRLANPALNPVPVKHNNKMK